MILIYQEHRVDASEAQANRLAAQKQDLELELKILHSENETEYGLIIDAQKAQIDAYSSQITGLKKQLKKSNANWKAYEQKYKAQTAQLAALRVTYAEQYDLEKQQLTLHSSKELEQKLSQLEDAYAAAANLKEQEQRVDELMADFTELKVSLDLVNICDKQYMDRYNQAKGMLSHIRTYVHKHELSRDFYHFVISNDSQITRQAREVCIEI